MLSQAPLHLLRERPFQGRKRRIAALPPDGRLDQHRKRVPQLSEERVDVRLTGSGIVSVQQGVVRCETKRLPFCLAGLAFAQDDFAEKRKKAGEVALGPRLTPGDLAPRCGLRASLHEIGRDGRRMDVKPPHLCEIAPLPILQFPRLLLRLAQQIADLRRGEHLVREHFKCRELLGAALRRAERHHGLLVPAQNADRVRDGGSAGETLFERAVSEHHVSRPACIRPYPSYTAGARSGLRSRLSPVRPV